MRGMKFINCNLEQLQLINGLPQELEALHLSGCAGNDEHYTRFINHFTKFKQLTVENISNDRIEYGAFLQQHLKEVNLGWLNTIENLNGFIRLNPQIEKMLIFDSTKYGQLDTC